MDVSPKPLNHGRNSQVVTRSYQEEVLDASLLENIIIKQAIESRTTHIAVLRMKIERDHEPYKVSWFIAPTAALCKQRFYMIEKAIGLVDLILDCMEPKQWTDPNLWGAFLRKSRVIVSTPQVLLDALSHEYIDLGRDISLLIFDEAHHVKDNHPMNCIMRNFYDSAPVRQSIRASSSGPVRQERPMIFGLTASLMFGDNATLAFRTLETNLDSVIRGPRQYVHPPEFKHVFYSAPGSDDTYLLASKNLDALREVVQSIDIQKDPYILFLRECLTKGPAATERTLLEQTLSEAILKSDSYTHKAINDLSNTARDICFDLGPWAADWYIQHVVEMAVENASPYTELTTELQDKEKVYLIEHLKRINVTPVSYLSQSIENGISGKLQILIRTLEEEKERGESFDKPYSGVVFVTGKATMVALAAVLNHHPRTRDQESFRVGYLLGSSESSDHFAFLDITRKTPRQLHAETLDEFRLGTKNLIITTATAKEGLDIQAYGNVILWNIPNNVASLAQSPGRARKQHCSFVFILNQGDGNDACIAQLEQLERDMLARYDTEHKGPQSTSPACDELEPCEFKVESTGALLTPQMAISHLNRFCSVLPDTRHTTYAAIYDIDPPDSPEGRHAFGEGQRDIPMYQGPFGCRLTLPKFVPPELRVYTLERKYPSKQSAYEHAAFKAYLELYKAGLLNDHLRPLKSIVGPELEEEVKEMLKGIGKRNWQTTSATSQLNPWLPSCDEENWWSTEIAVEGFPSLTLLTRVEIPPLGMDELPILYHPQRGRMEVKLGPGKVVRLSQNALKTAQESTRRLFWTCHGSRMEWLRLDFAYLLVINGDPDADTWLSRRNWAMKMENADSGRVQPINVEAFVSENGYPTDLTWIRDSRFFGKIYRFVGWRHEKLTEAEEAELRTRSIYSRLEDVRVTYPLLLVESFSQGSNFLLPLPVSHSTPKPICLLAKHSYLELLSPTECEYSQILPSILRGLETAMIIERFRNTFFSDTRLIHIPHQYLTTAMTAPAAGDPTSYERLETLGDTVLKFIVTLNLLATYPLWHEGYLSRRKDHTIANFRLAKEAIRHSIFRWIVRIRFSPKRFKPLYLPAPEEAVVTFEKPLEDTNGGHKTRKEVEDLSAKMLADVVESLIGVAYLHGGFDLGVSCARLFSLGLEWHTIRECVEMVLSRVQHVDELSTQLRNVEAILGYTFRRKLLLVESLTHASCQYDDRTVSYERMVLLGDALLDMIVVDFLYKYPGKSCYRPHDIHIRKSAVVNTHFLAYICFRSSLNVDGSIPGPGPHGEIVMQPRKNTIRLFQCLQHASSVILQDQELMFSRYDTTKDEIEEAFTTGRVFPWAALMRLQAPKVFSDMIESLIGAIYLDSRGNMDTVRELLWRLGILGKLDRFVRDGVDVLHPLVRLSVWASRQQKRITYDYAEDGVLIICTVGVEGREAVSASAEKRGHASREEARFAAAEKAISVWAVEGTEPGGAV